MPRVRILAAVAGESRTPGEVLELPGNEASALIAQQRAELVRDEPVERTTAGSTRVKRVTVERS